MSEGTFTGANFNNAALTWATATGASFVGATFNTANLEHAILKDADFSRADMTRGTFSSADVRGALFRDANLRYSRFGWVIAWGADFTRADLRDAYISQGLEAAKSGQKIIFYSADLRGANLEFFREFWFTDSRGAKLSGALMPDGTKHP
jgi:uncharacterized protein YjbI with pentapeptide repeats